MIPLLGAIIGGLLAGLAGLWRARWRLARQMAHQQRTLREQMLELRRVNAELGQLAHVKDDFLETINHQLRTPLTPMVQGLELLRDGAVGSLTADQQAIISTIYENALRLDGLVEAALDLSRLKSGRRPLSRAAGDLAAVLSRAQGVWQAAAQDHAIRLRCGVLPPVYMDAPAVQEVLDHLVRNALRHAPARSEITLEAALRDGAAQVSVHNPGPSLSPEQLARLFEPFVHLHTPDAPGSEGAGLGLALCRQIIERHRGSIRADAAPAGGTTMTFTLPLATPRFLFEEACRTAQEDAEFDEAQFGLLLFTAQPSAAEDQGAAERLRQAELVLRVNTHQGDQFVWLQPTLLAVIAVADGAGMEAMSKRLQGVLDRHGVSLRSAAALAPADGREPGGLLAAACRRLEVPVPFDDPAAAPTAGDRATIQPLGDQGGA